MNTRREEILNILSQSNVPVSGSLLAEKMKVSRQIIVSDISYLKSLGNDILSTTKGYIINRPKMLERVFKVVHSDDEIEDELGSIVELGAVVKDVYVWHKIYGKIECSLNIYKKQDVLDYLETLKKGRSSPLKNVTSQYHYHTVAAVGNDVLDKVEKMLDEKGYLVYED